MLITHVPGVNREAFPTCYLLEYDFEVLLNVYIRKYLSTVF